VKNKEWRLSINENGPFSARAIYDTIQLASGFVDPI
jgi:hypothetical protein